MTDEERTALLDELHKDCSHYNHVTKRVNNIMAIYCCMEEILNYSKEHYGNDKNESLITALSVATEETEKFCDAALACEREVKRKFYEKYGFRQSDWPPAGQEFEYSFGSEYLFLNFRNEY